MVMPPKFCPECQDEYVHSATVCADCNVPLVFEGELCDLEGTEDLPPISELVCIRASSVSWAMALSEKLAAAGIPHRIQAASADDGDGDRQKPGQNLPYGVFVLDDDAPRSPAWTGGTHPLFRLEPSNTRSKSGMMIPTRSWQREPIRNGVPTAASLGSTAPARATMHPSTELVGSVVSFKKLTDPQPVSARLCTTARGGR